MGRIDPQQTATVGDQVANSLQRPIPLCQLKYRFKFDEEFALIMSDLKTIIWEYKGLDIIIRQLVYMCHLKRTER